MNRNKGISFVVAAALAAASVSVLPASAEGDFYQIGDVDMDGVITGHDTAMVSRSIYDDSYSLTAEQYAMADINGDGVVDKSDMETIHELEEYMIGDMTMEKKGIYMTDAYIALVLSGYDYVWGCDIHLSPDAELVTNPSDFSSEPNSTIEFNQLQYNLLDSNADGIVTYVDAINLLYGSSYMSAGADSSHWYSHDSAKTGVRYDMTFLGADSANGDVDMDGHITWHDAAMVSRALYDDSYSLTDEQLAMADVFKDGCLTQSDLDYYIYKWADCTLELGNIFYEKDGVQEEDYATAALTLYSYQRAGGKIDVKPGGRCFVSKDELFQISGSSIEMNEVQYNNLDANADGVVDDTDASCFLLAASYMRAGGSYFEEVDGEIRCDLTTDRTK